jgi:hypothetical protein
MASKPAFTRPALADWDSWGCCDSLVRQGPSASVAGERREVGFDRGDGVLEAVEHIIAAQRGASVGAWPC